MSWLPAAVGEAVAGERLPVSSHERWLIAGVLTLDLAEARGVDPDLIRWDDPRWKAARDAYA